MIAGATILWRRRTCKKNTPTETAQGNFSSYIPIMQMKRIKKQSSVGKRTLTGFSFLYVLVSTIYIYIYLNWNTVDWSILCRSCCPPHCYHPGLEAEQSGHLFTLSCQHLSGSRRPQRNPLIHSSPCRQSNPIHSSETRCLGEFFLVLKPSFEPQLCPVGDICASMGTSISPYGSTCTLWSREASANACVL